MSPIIGATKPAQYGRKDIEDITVVGTGYNFWKPTEPILPLADFLPVPRQMEAALFVRLAPRVAANFSRMKPDREKVKVGRLQFDVVGVMEKQGSLLGQESLDYSVYIPVNRFFQEFLSIRGSISIMVRAASTDNMDDTKEEVRGIMRKIRGLSPKQEDDFCDQPARDAGTNV